VSYPCFYFPSFFFVTEAVRGRSPAAAAARLRAQFWPAYRVGLVAWTPAMIVQFYWVPLPLQVLWVSACSFCWTTFLCVYHI